MPRRRGEAGILAALDRWQRRHAAAAFAVAVVRKFVDDRAPGHAALIAYYAFFSVFPLLLVFVSVLGFLLEDDPSLKADVVDSALARIPVVGAQLDDEVEPLTGSGVALGVGVAGALWAGLGVTLALGRAFDAIWDVPRVEQRGPLRSRAFGLVVLVVLGAALVASTAASGAAVGGAIGPAAERLGALSVALVANAIVFLAAFGLLTARPVRTRELLPGVALAAAGALALQAAGAWFVDSTVTRASDTYGAFALVIGLLSWFLLLAQLLLLAAEVNVVLRRRLWPRALTGELTDADRLALRRAAEAARRDERQAIVVGFRDEPGARGLPTPLRGVGRTPLPGHSVGWMLSPSRSQGTPEEVGMEAHAEELGPVDIVVIAYPADAPMTGEAVPIVLDLVERGIIRVLDVLFVVKEQDGTYSGFEATDLDSKGVGDFAVFEGASSGLLGDDDAAAASDEIEPGSAAVILVYENRWAAPFAAAVRRNGGLLVGFQRVPSDELIASLETAEAAA